MKERIIQMKIKIYLKHVRTPFVAILSSESQFQSLLASLETDRIIHIGPLVFSIDEFSRIEIK